MPDVVSGLTLTSAGGGHRVARMHTREALHATYLPLSAVRVGDIFVSPARDADDPSKGFHASLFGRPVREVRTYCNNESGTMEGGTVHLTLGRIGGFASSPELMMCVLR